MAPLTPTSAAHELWMDSLLLTKWTHIKQIKHKAK